MAFDEGRFGLKGWFRRHWCTFGHRPPSIVDDRYEWVWDYVAITPTTGECCCLLLPHVDTICLNHLPRSAAGGVAGGTDRGGARWIGESSRGDRWAGRKGSCRSPLPAYSPELDPAERIFRHLQEAAGERTVRDDRGTRRDADARVRAVMDASEGDRTDDELSLVARSSQRYHATSIVKEYKQRLLLLREPFQQCHCILRSW